MIARFLSREGCGIDGRLRFASHRRRSIWLTSVRTRRNPGAVSFTSWDRTERVEQGTYSSANSTRMRVAGPAILPTNTTPTNRERPHTKKYTTGVSGPGPVLAPNSGIVL